MMHKYIVQRHGSLVQVLLRAREVLVFLGDVQTCFAVSGHAKNIMKYIITSSCGKGGQILRVSFILGLASNANEFLL